MSAAEEWDPEPGWRQSAALLWKYRWCFLMLRFHFSCLFSFASEISPLPRQSSLVHSEHFSTFFFFFNSKVRFPVFLLCNGVVVQCSLILLSSSPQQFSIERRDLTTGYVPL